MSMAENIAGVRKRIEEACARCGRNPHEITLVGASKTKPAELINEALMCGLEVIGENRVQELVEKYDGISPGAKIHLIGHLQTNKVKYIADKVSLIHSVDSEKLAEEISKQGKKLGRDINVLLQVNVSGEESKSGVSPEKLDELMEYIEKLPNIKVKGLMTIPPLDDGNMENTRKIFRDLYKIYIDKKQKKYNNIYMDTLSMGMSNDFEIAIEEGATMVRVGRAIFGTR